ncbi:hypothetical protein F5144DRAFT_138997 [Chaetomium tenue]|uniref:Uncharacterized protein n=1 Tax=Chaetomium tenue TaxID=1854479 RepID=A0ACB7PI02_9PEZI|nr:hypothetical protein F5144DRAFT_138997 [Chaetomium globosum]
MARVVFPSLSRPGSDDICILSLAVDGFLALGFVGTGNAPLHRGFGSLCVSLREARDEEKARHGKRPRHRPTQPARTSLCPRAASSEISDAGTRRHDKILGGMFLLPQPAGWVRAEPMLSRPPPVSLKAKHAIRARRIVPCNSLTVWGGKSSSRGRQGTRILPFFPAPTEEVGGRGRICGWLQPGLANPSLEADDELAMQAAEQR